jgi:hypothetical protein
MANNNEFFKVRHGLKVGDNLSVDASTGDIESTGALSVTTTSNGNITLAPNGTGDVQLQADAVTVGTGSATGIISSRGAYDLLLQTNDGTNSGTIVITDGANGDITIDPNGTGKVIIAGDLQVDGTTTTINSTTLDVDDINITIAKGSPNAANSNGGGITLEGPTTAATITYASADDSWNFNKKTSAPELQIDNININGNTIISTDTNGSITLDPNGTGDVALTLADGGNLTNTRNYVFGAIRNSTTDSNGDIWVLDADAGGAGTLPVRGVSLDNSGLETTKNAGVVVRNYSTTAGFGPRVVFERSRGTAASPATLNSGDTIGAIAATGYTSTTGWINDTLPFAPAAITINTTEAWVSNTNLGTNFVVSVAPTATTITTASNLIQCINTNPQSSTYRSDAFTFRQGKSGTTNFLTLGTAAANLSADTVTLETSAGTDMLVLTTASGALKADSITLETSSGTDMMTLTTSAANIISTATNIRNASNTQQVGISGGGSGQETELKINKENATGTPVSSEVATINFTTTRATGNASQSGDKLGQFKFNGSLTTGGTPAPTCSINGYAAENFTATAQGGRFIFQTNKIGTTTSYNPIYVDSGTMELSSDAIYFKNSAGTAQTSAGINYTRTYGEFAYTNAAGFAIAAQNTIYTMPLDTTLNNSGVTISNTSRININVSGWYKIIMSLQATLTVTNQPGQFDFWLRKNGSDVANSKTQVDLLKDQKSVISMDWLVNSDGNDYWEIVYVGTTTNYADIDFPTIAATTTPYVSPVAPALLVNVIPAGM